MIPRNRLIILTVCIMILVAMIGFIPTRVAGFPLNDQLRLKTMPPGQGDNPPDPAPVILTDNQDQYPLGLNLAILKDTSGELTIEDVSSPAYEGQFLPSEVPVPNYGYESGAYWVRAKFRNDTQNNNNWLLDIGFANMHYADLYTPMPDGNGYSVKQSGVLRPLSSRDIFHPRIVFNLVVPTQTEQTIYMRFQNGGSMTIPLTLWKPQAFLNYSIPEENWMGVFYGVMIGLLVYNIFLLLSLREKSYLYLLLFLVIYLFWNASYDGYLEIYLFTELSYLKVYYFPLFFVGTYVLLLVFGDHVLAIKTRLPGLHRILMILVAGWGLLLLMVPFTNLYSKFAELMVIWALLCIGVLLVGAFILLQKGYTEARFFIITWFGYMISMSVGILVRLGIVPSSGIAENLYRYGALWLTVGMSIALADRINQLKTETEEANRDLKNSEQRLSQILDALPLGVVLYEKDQKAKYANKRSIDMLSNPTMGIVPAISAGRTLAQSVQYFSLKKAGSSEDYPVEEMPVYKALRGEPAMVDDVEMEKGEQKMTIEMAANPVRDEAGNIDSAVLVMEDITERKQVEAELAEYRKSLEILVEKRTAELSASNEQLIREATERKKLEKSFILRIGWLSQIYDIHQSIAGMADLAGADEELSQVILQLLDASMVFILRWGDQDDQFTVHCRSMRKVSDPDIEALKSLFGRDTVLRNELDLGKTVMIPGEKVTFLPQSMGDCFQRNVAQSLILIPMIIHQTATGVLGIASLQSVQDLSFETKDLIERMTFDLASLAADAMLLDQKRVLVTMEERNRLARELHDSVAQGLYSIGLFTDAIRLALESGKLNVVKQHLDELVELSREAMSDMRLLIFELRPPLIEKEGLAGALQGRLDAVEARAKIQTIIQLEGDYRLSKDQESEMYRIAQEALNNVIKHAHAREVKVQLIGEARCVRMVIEDNGVGFYPETAEHGGGQGLRNMCERAERIGGKCSFASIPGQGTKVAVEVKK